MTSIKVFPWSSPSVGIIFPVLFAPISLSLAVISAYTPVVFNFAFISPRTVSIAVESELILNVQILIPSVCTFVFRSSLNDSDNFSRADSADVRSFPYAGFSTSHSTGGGAGTPRTVAAT